MDATIVVTLNRFPELAAALAADVPAALDAAVAATIAAADPVTRVRTGALVGTKTIEATPESRTITWDMPYAIYQSEGTRFMSGTHFAEAGADAAAPGLLAALAAGLGG